MNGYEYSSANPFASRGNGSAYELLNNPALFGFGVGTFGNQPNAGFTSPFGTTQPTPQPYTQQTNPNFQQPTNPWQHQQFNPQWQHQVNPQWQQQQFNPQWQQQSQQPWQTQPNSQTAPNTPWGPQTGWGTTPTTNTGVHTTKAVDVNLTIPAQTILGRNPIEVQQYVLQVVIPTLLDALTKRAIAHDVGQSISYDLRGGCIARVGI